MDTTRTTFLKKRLMSTVFDEVEGQFVDAGDRRRPECGRALGHLSRKARPGGEGGGGQGRAVRPARRGSLDGPRSQVVASHNRQGTPSGVPGCFGAGGHSGDLTTGAQNWAGQAVGFGCRTFLRPEVGAWCVSGHSQAGCTQFTGLARWGPRRSSSSRLGCVRTVLNRPPCRRLAARRTPG
jgi:hypothetical protein